MKVTRNKRKAVSTARIKCICGMRVPDTFVAKLLHMYDYHPLDLVKTMPRVAELSRAAGEYLGEQMKKGFTNG